MKTGGREVLMQDIDACVMALGSKGMKSVVGNSPALVRSPPPLPSAPPLFPIPHFPFFPPSFVIVFFSVLRDCPPEKCPLGLKCREARAYTESCRE